MAPDMAAQVEQCLGRARKAKVAEQVKLAVEMYRLASMALFAAAQLFAEARERTTTSRFAAALDRMEMPRQTVDRLIMLHERFQALPAARSLAHYGLSKLEVISRLDDAEIESLANGEEVRGIDLERLDTASCKQLELDLFASQSSSAEENSHWKRRYERLAREHRSLKQGGANTAADFQRRCSEALAAIQTGVDQLLKLALEAQEDARGPDRLNDSVELLAKTVKSAGVLLQHRFGKAKNSLARLARESDRLEH